MSAPSRQSERVLLVRIGSGRRALPMARLEGVAGSAALIALPGADCGLCGAVPFRGQVVPVLDPAALLGETPQLSGPLVFLRRSGAVLAIRVAAVLGVDRAGAGEMLDPDALPLPALPARERLAEGAIHRREPKPQRTAVGLLLRLGGRQFSLEMQQVIEVAGGLDPVPVPWADPLLPALLMRNSEPVAVVRMDVLLGLPEAGAGPFVVCRTGADRLAFRVDEMPVVAERGAAPALDLQAALRLLPPGGASPPPRPQPMAGARSFMAVQVEAQPCLLPLQSIRSVAAHVRPIALPGARPPLLGARAIRGRVLPVVDPRPALALPGASAPEHDLELAPHGAPPFVLAVQVVDTVVRLRPEALRPGPGEAIPAVASVGGRRAWVLDPASLLRAARSPA